MQDQIFSFRNGSGGSSAHGSIDSTFSSKAVFSPRTTLLFSSLGTSQTFRLSFNRAFRAPSFVNTLLDTTFFTDVDLGAAGPFALTTLAKATRSLKEEALTAYEAGYIGGFGRMTVGAAVYLNHTKNMIQFTRASYYTSSHPPVGWPVPPAVLDQLVAQGRGLPSRYTYLNYDRISDHGVELSADINVTRRVLGIRELHVAGRSEADRVRYLGAEPAADTPIQRGSEPHARAVFSAASRQLRRHSLLAGRAQGYDGPDQGVHTGGRRRSVCTRPTARMTVAVRATNLLNQPMQQHVFGDVIRRTVIGEVRFEF